MLAELRECIIQPIAGCVAAFVLSSNGLDRPSVRIRHIGTRQACIRALRTIACISVINCPLVSGLGVLGNAFVRPLGSTIGCNKL